MTADGAAGRAVVVGGGVAGLATAALLARDGWEVHLVEQRDDLGGRAGTWEQDGFRFDTGPSWYLMPEVFEHFFRLLGTSTAEQLDLVRLDPAYRVFFERHQEPLTFRENREANAEVFEAVEIGAGAALDRYLESARSVYQLALRHFLYSTFENRAALLHPEILRGSRRLLRLLSSSLQSFTTAQFTDPRLRQVLGYPAVFLGTSPDRAPALYHLMSWLDLADGVFYPRGGFGTLVGALVGLAHRAGATLHTGTTATAIEVDRTSRGARVRGVRVLDSEGVEAVLVADVVVAAADLHHVETELVPSDLRTYDEEWWRRRDPGPGAVLACLGVRGALPELAHHTLFFTEDWQQNFGDIFEAPTRVPDPASAYVCRPSATDRTVAPEGHENLFVLVPVPADPGIGRGGVAGAGDPSVEQIVDDVVTQIGWKAGVPDLRERIVLRRTFGPGDFATDLNAWCGGALGPAHVLRQSAFFRAGNASRRVSGLFYAGAGTLPGIGLPMCLISAELALKRVRRDRSTGPLPEPGHCRRLGRS